MYDQFLKQRRPQKWIIVVGLVLLVACATSSSTPTATIPPTKIMTGQITQVPNTNIPIITVSPGITPTVIGNIDSSPATITAIPDVQLNQTEEVAPYPTDVGILVPVSVSDPNWATIMQRVNELDGLHTLALSPDGELLATVDSYDEYSRVYLWNIETGDAEWILELDQALATSELVFSPDGTKLAVGTSDVVQDIFVWATVDGNLLHRFVYQTHTIDMKFSPDNHWLAVSGSIPEPVTVWNLGDERMIEFGRGVAIDFVPQSSTAVLVIARGQKSPNQVSPIYFVNLQTEQTENLFLGEYFAGNLAISPDGQYLATFITDKEGVGTIRVLNLYTNEELNLEENELGTIAGTRQIGFSASGHLAVLHSNLTVWNIAGEIIGTLDGRNIKGFILTPDGSFLLTFGVFDSPLEIWQLPALE
jgi:hypothetical protein